MRWLIKQMNWGHYQIVKELPRRKWPKPSSTGKRILAMRIGVSRTDQEFSRLGLPPQSRQGSAVVKPRRTEPRSSIDLCNLAKHHSARKWPKFQHFRRRVAQHRAGPPSLRTTPCRGRHIVPRIEPRGSISLADQDEAPQDTKCLNSAPLGRERRSSASRLPLTAASAACGLFRHQTHTHVHLSPFANDRQHGLLARHVAVDRPQKRVRRLGGLPIDRDHDIGR